MKYSFNDANSLIKEVQVYQNRKELEAIIQIPLEADNGHLSKISGQLQAGGFDVLAGTDLDNNAVLKVYNFGSANNLLSAMANISLGEKRALSGQWSAEKNELDNQHNAKDDNWLKRAAIFTAGCLYTVGNFSTIGAGWVRGNSSEIWQGFAWAGPGIALMLGGLQTAETQMPFVYNDLNEFLKQNDIKVPANVQNLINERKTDNNLWDQTWRFATGNASDAFTICEAIGAIKGIQAGLELKNPYKVIGSAVMGTGMITSFLTKEEHIKNKQSYYIGNAENRAIPEPETTNDGLLGFMQKHSMVAAGLCANIQNIIKIAGIFEVDQKNRTDFEGVKNSIAENMKDDEIISRMRQSDYNANTLWKSSDQGLFGRIKADKPIEGRYYQEKIKLQNDQAEAIAKLKNTQQGSDEEKLYATNWKKADDALDALDKQRDKYIKSDDASKLDSLAIGSFMVANAITMVTSKDNTPDLVKSGGFDALVEISANIVNNYEADARRAVTQRIATFIGNHKYLHVDVDDVVSAINDKVEALSGNKQLGFTEEFQVAERLDGASKELIANQNTPKNKIDADVESLEKLYNQSPQISSSEELEAKKRGLERILSKDNVSNQQTISMAM